ncbi:MAG TPA: hypothetical protein VJU18_10795 [Vicinamibacteria bacterium]|nr:hypothetical protein [Vicinamibacteria bacterium]
MSRERAKSYADRLPPVVPKEEADISHLSDEMAEILYPGRRSRPFRMGVVFDAFEAAEYQPALALARRSPEYREEAIGSACTHRALFDTQAAGTLRELFRLVGDRPGTEVLVDGKPVPYARELWLPLFWLFVGEGS